VKGTDAASASFIRDRHRYGHSMIGRVECVCFKLTRKFDLDSARLRSNKLSIAHRIVSLVRSLVLGPLRCCTEDDRKDVSILGRRTGIGNKMADVS
jgi:hypothetical protein